jgi:hypothetical protein
MSPRVPSLAEIEATVARMEQRYSDHPLFAKYLPLTERFDADLSDPRDRALARSAALMLIKIENEN